MFLYLVCLCRHHPLLVLAQHQQQRGRHRGEGEQGQSEGTLIFGAVLIGLLIFWFLQLDTFKCLKYSHLVIHSFTALTSSSPWTLTSRHLETNSWNESRNYFSKHCPTWSQTVTENKNRNYATSHSSRTSGKWREKVQSSAASAAAVLFLPTFYPTIMHWLKTNIDNTIRQSWLQWLVFLAFLYIYSFYEYFSFFGFLLST